MKKKITKKDVLMLEGILILSAKLHDQLDEYRKIVRETIGEEDEHGFSSDFVYSGVLTVETLLECCEIKIEK